jgi:formylglycine-generating enzyme required for sulfatase activity
MEMFLRVTRGGDFGGSTQGLEPSYRMFNVPTARLNNQGFRCARSP